MSILGKKKALENQIAQIKKELKSIEQSATFKKEAAVFRGLIGLMKKHNCSESDIVRILESNGSFNSRRDQKADKKPQRKRRVLKIYENPKTGEVVETRGGNHKTLKAWRMQNPSIDIETWIIETRK